MGALTSPFTPAPGGLMAAVTAAPGDGKANACLIGLPAHA
jgi:uncharacterized protein YggU (UPF0235/DUF167 family)